MEPNPDQILQRLEELRQWQEEQQLALRHKQVAQRDLLNQEQNKLYEMLGLSMDSTVRSESESTYDPSQLHPELLQEIMNESVANCNKTPLADRMPVQHAGRVKVKPDVPRKYVEPEACTGKENEEQFEEPVRRTFLKRGEGLQSRFKVNPESLRLNNLPKYKFAGAHRNSKFFKNSVQKIVLKAKPNVSMKEMEEIHTHCRVEAATKESDPISLPNLPIRNQVTWDKCLENPDSVVFSCAKGNYSIQDTPTREIIRKQQRELDELDVFEHLEANISNIPTPTKTLEEHNSSASSREARRPLHANTDSDETLVGDAKATAGKVRFMSQVLINEAGDISECETVESSDMDRSMQINHTSTPNTRTAFQAFRSNLLGNSASIQLDDTTIQDDVTKRPHQSHSMEYIHQQSEQMKVKLVELEREIELFRSQNAGLTKAKQQMELDRIQMGEERIEIEERLSDERIKMEVYLHDERMKLLSEKETLDRRAKELRGPNRKEREETAGLKAQVAALETELASREQRHVSAQARLRAQLRTMEKDVKDYSYEIENLKKENKKLEAENVRLRRQNNNKMLSEINRNIAKLTVVNAPNDKVDEKEKSSSKSPTVATTKPPPKVRSRSEPRTRVQKLVDADRSETSESEAENVENPSNYFNQSKMKTKDPTPEKSPAATSLQNLEPRHIDQQQNCKREILNSDGSKDILYPNGNIKKISKDTMEIRMLYFNKDIKETNINEGTVKYYYAESNTWHTSYLDGLEILEFPNGQTEHRFKDGRVEVHFPNGSIRITDSNQAELQEEWRYPDGTQVVQMRNGEKVLSLPNGQREIHTEQHKRREYPDGTVKLVYPDGSQETRYSNGRVRLKDKSGSLVMDSDSMLVNANK